MPLYEYTCEGCGYYNEKLEFGDEANQQHPCPICERELVRIVSPCTFKLEYNNKTDMCDWRGNTSHYWDEYKKAKAEGNDVKPHGED